MINPREIASSLLFNVYKGKKLDWALGSNKDHIKLDARDRSFVNLLVLTALRRNGQINQVIMDFIEKPLKKFTSNFYFKNSYSSTSIYKNS